MKTTLFRNTFAALAALFIALFALPQQAQAENYSLMVANVQVTSANCNDLSVLPGVSGTASYDPATKTLYLENATIKTKRMNGISSYIDGLTIQVKGTVRVTSEELSSLCFNRPATITGGGTLNATGSGNDYGTGIYVDECQVTIDGCTVNAKGKWGICGNDGTLIVRKANVTAEGSKYGSIYDLNNLALIGCAIAKPAGAAFNTSLKGVALNGQIVKKKVTIEPVTTTYELFVAGTRVTSDNCDDLSVIPGVTGTAYYDPATKDLHLHDATITATGTGSGIASEIAGMSIRMTGTNSVTSQKVPAINFQRFGHIFGNGTLNVTSSENTAIFLKQHLDIGGGTVNAKGTRGIAGYDGTTETLTVRNATVTAEGDGTNPSLCNLKTLNMQNCYVTRPSGAAFNAALKGVAQGGQLVKTKVRIGKQVATPYGLKIAGKQVNSDNAADLTELSGVTGTASYDHATKTLTLENATIAATNHDNGIRSETDGLTVRVKGTVNVTAQNYSAINFTKSATITGGGTLNATSSENGGIYLKDDLTIDGCTVNVKGKWGISGDGIPATTTLTVRNANITTQGKIEDLKDLVLEGCVINYPAGAVFDPSAQAVIHDGHFALAVKIGPPTYDLHIAGVQVTAANCADLTAIPGVTGTVKYDHSTKTLTLQDAAINTTGNKPGIVSDTDGLTVQVKGTVNVTTQEPSALRLTKPTTITGGGTLNATSSNDCGIYVYQTRLTIDGTIVNAKGEYGIAGEHGHSETLTVKNATVTAECNGTEGSIIAIKTLTLDGCVITQPAGAAFDASLKGIALNGQLVKEKVVIGQPVGTPYELYVAGTQVTSLNAADLTAIPGVTGIANYDPTTKTLTLDGATLTATGSNDAIAGEIDGLTIRVNGNVNITAQKSGISSTQPFTITGSATLNVTSNEACGIYVNETDLTIDGTTVNAKGTWGIAGQRSDVETLTLRNATVNAEGTNGSIIDFKALTLNGCAITQPAGAAYDASLKGIAQGGQLVKTKVTIEPATTPTPTAYDLLIAGVQVTADNCADLAAIPGVTGTASYDPATKTLTLDGCTIDATGPSYGIVGETDVLTVRVKGTVSVTSQADIAIGSMYKMTITGDGTLNATANGAGITAGEALTIDGCTVHVKAFMGIGSGAPSGMPLILRNANVTAEGSEVALGGLSSLTLDGCKITQPTGAVYDASLKGVALGGQLVKGKVEITRIPTAIDAPAAAPLKKQGTYTLHGVKLQGTLESLPAGVYIVNGKKVVKK